MTIERPPRQSEPSTSKLSGVHLLTNREPHSRCRGVGGLRRAQTFTLVHLMRFEKCSAILSDGVLPPPDGGKGGVCNGQANGMPSEDEMPH